MTHRSGLAEARNLGLINEAVNFKTVGPAKSEDEGLETTSVSDLEFSGDAEPFSTKPGNYLHYPQTRSNLGIMQTQK